MEDCEGPSCGEHVYECHQLSRRSRFGALGGKVRTVSVYCCVGMYSSLTLTYLIKHSAQTSQFRDLSGMFQHAIRFEGNVSRWDLSNAIEMDEMFHNAISFNDDISRWDTSNVVTMARMFRNATKFTGLGQRGGIRWWNVQSVRNFYG